MNTTESKLTCVLDTIEPKTKDVNYTNDIKLTGLTDTMESGFAHQTQWYP